MTWTQKVSFLTRVSALRARGAFGELQNLLTQERMSTEELERMEYCYQHHGECGLLVKNISDLRKKTH
jgi:hypothetical protein